jgi:hypothetical protein
LSDSIRFPPRLSLLNSNSATPFDISSCVVSSSDALRNRRDISSAGNASNKSARQAKRRDQSITAKNLNQPSATIATQSGGNIGSSEVKIDKEDNSFSESDYNLLVDLEAAINAALASKIVPVEDVVIQEKDKKGGKKGVGTDAADVKGIYFVKRVTVNRLKSGRT